jgi:putative transposase
VKAKLGLDERTYRCECGLEIDRDLNAARNLAAYGQRIVAGSGPETLNVRGGEYRLEPQPSPTKREDGSTEVGKAVTALSQDEAA